MRILVLCNRVPHPLHDGGNIAVMAILKGLKKSGAAVHLLTMNTSRHPVDSKIANQELSFLDAYHIVPIDNQITIPGAIGSLISGKSYHVRRFINMQFNDKLIDILKKTQFDIIHLEGLYVTPYFQTIRSITDTPIVYRQHNIEFKIWEKTKNQNNNPFKRWYINKLTNQLRKYELRFLQKVKYIVPISFADLKENIHLGANAEQLWIPYGIEDEAFELLNDHQCVPRKVYHIGAMDWSANQDGIHWFLDKVWDKVIASFPDATFDFAGRNMPESFIELEGKYQNVTCAGEIQDAKSFEAHRDILIVPVRVASGIRIKTLKALAHGKPVVSTSIGAKGLEAEKGKHLLIADDPNDFAVAITNLMRHPQEYHKMRKEGFHWVQANYNNDKIIQKLISFYDVIRKPDV